MKAFYLNRNWMESKKKKVNEKIKWQNKKENVIKKCFIKLGTSLIIWAPSENQTH